MLVIISISTNTIERIKAKKNISSIAQSDRLTELEKKTATNVEIKVKINPPKYPSIDLSVFFGKWCFLCFSPENKRLKIVAIASATDVIRMTMKRIGKQQKMNGANAKTMTDVLENVSSHLGINLHCTFLWHLEAYN